MKVLLHAHTTFSRDGHLSPERLARLAARRGFSYVFLTEHFEDLSSEKFAQLAARCAAIETPKLIPGYERDWDGFHLLALAPGLWAADAELAVWRRRIVAAGGLICLAHPKRYAFRAPAAILAACDAVEVWNSKRPYDGWFGPDPRAYGLVSGGRSALAGQDVHRRRDLNRLATVIEPAADARAAVAALGRGPVAIGRTFWRWQQPPAGAARLLLGGWQRLRPALWAPPVALYRRLRSLVGGAQ